MGWSSTNDMFDLVAQTLSDLKATPDTKREVLGMMIKRLRDMDWDTCDESLEKFANDPAVVQAFADNEIFPQQQEALVTFLSSEFGLSCDQAKALAPQIFPTIRERVELVQFSEKVTKRL